MIDRLEADRRQQAETIDEQQATIDRLSADIALLKRALFGSRRERFQDDPNQQYLFDSTEVKPEEASLLPRADDREVKRRRTSKGRRRRVFPEALPRKTVQHKLDLFVKYASAVYTIDYSPITRLNNCNFVWSFSFWEPLHPECQSTS